MSNQNALFDFVTKMEKDDFRKFMYLITFNRKKHTISRVILLAAAASGLDVMTRALFTPLRFLVVWMIFIVVGFAAIFLRTEYKASKRWGEVGAGLNSNNEKLTFYENYLIAVENNASGSNKIKYDDLFQIKETKDYYIIFASESAASMIRKIDIEEEERDDFREFLKRKMGSRFKDATPR